jgi:ribonucleoside-triphosphate reductase
MNYAWLAKPTLTLDPTFYQQYEKREPKWGPIGRTVFFRTYARKKADGKVESVPEVFKRVVEGHWSLLKNWQLEHKRDWNEAQGQRNAQRAFEVFWQFLGLPSGRALWTMGTPCIEKTGGSALNNCAFVSTRDGIMEPLAFMMDQSMLGVGVAFDVLGAGKFKVLQPGDDWPYEIPDTREGWVESVRYLCRAFLQGAPYPIFNYQQIRPAGSPIHGFGGVSSGPEPLKQLHVNLHRVFMNSIGDTLTSVAIADLMNYVGVCVVSGNVRRTAQLCLGLAEDQDYLARKDERSTVQGPDSWRWASNDSVIGCSGMDYSWAPQRLETIGDLGFFWKNNAQRWGRFADAPSGLDTNIEGTNPCGEIGLEPFELCNLVEMYPSRFSELQANHIYSVAKTLYLCAKAVSLVDTNWEDTNDVIHRNHRIGFSLSGLMRSYALHGVRQTMAMCDRLYTFIRGIDRQYSDWLGVPTSIKTTTIQPSGTKSLLIGEPPGLHPAFAPYYLRRVEYQEDDPSLDAFHAQGFRMTERKEKHTVVVEFPIAEVPGTPTYQDSNLWSQMKRAAEFQKWWADNQISCTVTVKPEEMDQLPEALSYFEDDLKGISFLKEQHDFANPPYEVLTEKQYQSRQDELKLKRVKFSTDGVGESFCDAEGRCLL